MRKEFLPIASPRIEEADAKAVYEVVKSGWISMGRKVKEFEETVCSYTDSKYAVAMNNGTATLHALLIALDISSGDEVIVPSMTYISSANVVLYQGGNLVLCDNDPITFNATPELVRKKITSRTKAFMTVDMKGLPVDYDAFNSLSEETGIPYISDSAESYGAVYKGKKVGSQAKAHSFSFFANKNITTGEGGIVTTNDEKLFHDLLIIRNQGQEGRYNHTWLGNNFRMTDILAALGIEQLKKIDSIIEKKVQIANNYNKYFSKVPNISVPYIPDYVNRPSWYNYSISTSRKLRNHLLEYLEKQKIETRLSFPPVHIQPYYKKRFGYKENSFSKALKCFQTFIDIPIWADMGLDNQSYVQEKIHEFFIKKGY